MFISLLLLLSWQAQPDLAEKQGSQRPIWTYYCFEGNCFRNETPSFIPPLYPTLSSLSICRLSCGEYGSMWPRPQEANLRDILVETHPSLVEFDLGWVVGGEEPKMFLAKAAKRILERWELSTRKSTPSGRHLFMVEIKLITTTPDMSLSLDTIEDYSVTITSHGKKLIVEINGTTIYGVRNGLETIGQLAEPWEGLLVMVGGGTITDFPAFSHRGVLIDTSRHFLSIKAIKRTLDAMAASKINVLHWHATDSHSFPVDFPSVPEMSRYGAYSNEKIYATEEIKQIIEYAKERGIRVMFELDTPSHSGNGWQWGESQGLGNLAVCINKRPWRSYCVQPPCGQLNPVNPNVYTVLGKLYKDIQSLFSTENMFHMGGDEVHFPCWNSTKEITDWMKSAGLGRTREDFLKVWGSFQREALKEWDQQAGHSRTPIVLWSSHLTEPDVVEQFLDPKRYIIETWVDSIDKLPNVLLSKGYKLILVTKDAWYFDHGFEDGSHFHTWKTVYNSKIENKEGVLGGEGCLWGELTDENSLDNKLWPRAAALVERLWLNPEPYISAYEAEPRLLEHGERLKKMGLKPAAITPEWCYHNDGLISSVVFGVEIFCPVDPKTILMPPFPFGQSKGNSLDEVFANFLIDEVDSLNSALLPRFSSSCQDDLLSFSGGNSEGS